MFEGEAEQPHPPPTLAPPPLPPPSSLPLPPPFPLHLRCPAASALGVAPAATPILTHTRPPPPPRKACTPAGSLQGPPPPLLRLHPNALRQLSAPLERRHDPQAGERADETGGLGGAGCGEQGPEERRGCGGEATGLSAENIREGVLRGGQVRGCDRGVTEV